jgi:hypothetical protein
MGQKERLSVMAVARIEAAFPKIRKEGYKITSVETPDYNCFAWVTDDKSKWWSPVTNGGYYWPADVPKNLAVKSFITLYKREGNYEPCDNERHEKGFEKIAIYADALGDVTHVAKQKPSGKWTSKLGDWEDLEHDTLAALEGNFYGNAVQILKRAVK